MKTPVTYILNFLILSGLHSYANQITVSEHYLSDEIKQAATFYAEILGIKNANILIQCHPFFSGEINGYTLYEEKPEYTVKNILIRINSHQHFSGLLITLAHEMIHARQFITGQLKHHQGNHYSWKDKVYNNIELIDYQSRKWEKEAFSGENFLFEQYRKHSQTKELQTISY